MKATDLFNLLSRVLLGTEIDNLFFQASLAKQEWKKAEQLSQNNQFSEAVKIGLEIINKWSLKTSLIEQLFRQIVLDEFLDQVSKQLKGWQKRIAETEKLANRAKEILKTDRGNPLETQALEDALKLYKQCERLISDYHLILAVEQCEKILYWREQFQLLVTEAKALAERQFFKQALSKYQAAQKLFSTVEVAVEIASLSVQIQNEEIYEAALQKAHKLSQEERFQESIALLESANANFSRSDGRDYLALLKQIVEGNNLFRNGLIAEKAGDLNHAASLYQKAALLLPSSTECCIRQAVVAIKKGNWSETISYLNGIVGEQAAYIRGFAKAQMQEWDQADREWKFLFHTEVQEQSKVLKTFKARDRLLTIKEIEQFVDAENLEIASNLSQELIQKFGCDELVQTNLEGHILPRLEATLWETGDWQQIADAAQKTWNERLDIVSLHNWAIASYYCAQTDPSKLPDAIASQFTLLANINADPSLKDIPWLGSTPIDVDSVKADICKLLENTIDSLKDQNLPEYLRMRDHYRLEFAALRLIGNPATCDIKLNRIFLTPGCYDYFRSFFTGITFPAKIWAALYTDWGLAIAACLEGDLARAIQIKPSNTESSDVERFAKQFVFYHEGCYYLQQQKWRDSIASLKEALTEIKANSEWCQEIDRLCNIQRQAIDNFKEHLDFSQFWYELTDSQSARSYLVEYKAQEIEEKLAAEQITPKKALQQLEVIKLIDVHNPIVRVLSERIEVTQELTEIDNLLKKSKFEEGVRLAKRSRYERVREAVSKVCIEILVQGFKSRELGFDHIYNLGHWAYELCPDDPFVEEIYHFSQELKEIEDLMKRDRFDEAIRRAKYSKHTYIQDYVADFFMMVILKGMKNQNMSFELMRQLGQWAYELCPNEPNYQLIYQQLGIRS